MIRPILLSTVLLSGVYLQAQQFLMQSWYWEFPKSVSSPTNFAVTLRNQAPELAEAGFTDLWLPPLSKGSGGGFSVGYDVRDLFDLGEFGSGATGFGTRAELDALIGDMEDLGMRPVADVIYNHRDNGKWENNPAVQGWIYNFSFSQAANNNTPFPSDRWRCVLPIGGTTGNTAGDYYFKISSASQHPNFHGHTYKVYMWTKRKPTAGLTDQFEVEPNGGGDCGQPFNTIQVGRGMIATIDGSGCTADEFYLPLGVNDYFAAGDTLYIELRNLGGYSDHRIYGLWSAVRSMDIQSEIRVQTATNFTSMPSGRGDMDWRNFKPNGAPTTLAGDLDFPWFFYDYDNNVSSTRDTLIAYSKWLWEDAGVRGYRLDAVKHFPASSLGEILNSMHSSGYNPPIVVGEFFDFNPFVLNNWVNNVENSMTGPARSAIDVRAFDFALRGALKSACDAFGYDVRNVFNSGMVNGAGGSPFGAVTFANNHDFRSPGEPIQNDPMLAYAYVLTNNSVGVPCVYYPDYYGAARPNAPTVNLKSQIDKLMAVHDNFIFGSTAADYLNRFGTPYTSNYLAGSPNTTLLYQLGNNPSGVSVLVAINFNGGALRVNHNINTGIGVSPGDTLWAIAGSANNAFTVVSGSSSAYIDLPGRSYAVYVNCNRPGQPLNPQSVVYCPSDPIPPLTVEDDGGRFDWYTAASGGTRVQQNSATFATSTPGTYWVERVGDCGSSERIPVSLTADVAACNCALPATINQGAILTRSVIIFWDAVADATGYQVQGRPVGAPAFKNLQIPGTSRTISNLNPGTSYEWRLRTFCGGTTFSDWSPLRTFTTLTPRLGEGMEELQLYPNPAMDRVTVQGQLSGEEPAQLEVVDMLGRSRLQQQVAAAAGIFQAELDLQALENGFYLVLVHQNGQVQSLPLEVNGR